MAEKKPVAFIIHITGVMDVEYDDSPGAMAPVEEFEAMVVRQSWTDATHVIQEARGMGLTVEITPDDTRNYPRFLGGYMMPEDDGGSMACPDCGGYLDHPAGECPSPRRRSKTT